MGPLRSTEIRCECCELAHPERLATPVVDAGGDIRGWRCATCEAHRDDALAMARDHEDQVRARWRDTIDELNAVLDQVDDYRDKMQAAARSRDHVLRQFEKLARYHRGTDDGCICGKRNCETLGVIDVDWITDRIATMHRLEQSG